MDGRKGPRHPGCFLAILFILQVAIISCQSGEDLKVGFYSKSCPNVEAIVLSTVLSAMIANRTMAAAVLRLHFHDCFVKGCDGSILLDGPNAERFAPGNARLRGFDVIESAKSKLEETCKGVVSCADILALAARDAIVLSKGPFYRVPTGRRDGSVSSIADALDLPNPSDSISTLLRKFAEKGLSASDLVVLTGAHTIGSTACDSIEQRLYNFTTDGQADPSINPSFLKQLKRTCPRNGDVNVTVPLDPGSEFRFDKSFLRHVRNGQAVLRSDAALYENDTTRAIVDSYTRLLSGLFGPFFSSDFADAMVRMGKIEVKTGSDGHIRTVCSNSTK